MAILYLYELSRVRSSVTYIYVQLVLHLGREWSTIGSLDTFGTLNWSVSSQFKYYRFRTPILSGVRVDLYVYG